MFIPIFLLFSLYFSPAVDFREPLSPSALMIMCKIFVMEQEGVVGVGCLSRFIGCLYQTDGKSIFFSMNR